MGDPLLLFCYYLQLAGIQGCADLLKRLIMSTGIWLGEQIPYSSPHQKISKYNPSFQVKKEIAPNIYLVLLPDLQGAE